MPEQEKFGSKLEYLLQHFENSLTKRIAKFKEILENCKNSTQYQRDQRFRGQCDSIEGLLADMSNDLEMVRRAKANLQ